VILGVSWLGPLACAPLAGPAPGVLELVQRLPKVSDGVLLNEPLELYFSDELDRASVTSYSVRITDERGRQARGSFEVEGDSLRFVPAPVYKRDLSDGGFRPGTRYGVELVGFPDPACLRAARGGPLAGTRRWAFRTVTVGGPQGAVAFRDATPEHGSPLKPPRETIVQGEQLILRCDEPIDPSTLDDDDFVIRQTLSAAGVQVPDAEPVPVSLFLRPPEAGSPEAAWLELLPARPLEPGGYRIEAAPQLSLRDYGGNLIWVPPMPKWGEFRVVGGPRNERNLYRERFLDTVRRSPVAPPATDLGVPDGTACWDGDGAVRIRYPLAAGDGADGPVELAPREPRADVRATRLELEDGAECRLAAEGLVVLRAQGRLRIGGRLRRILPAGAGGPLSMKDSFAGQPLSEWLARASAAGEPWTVLVAGGDLVVAGELDVATPVLLVAGGVVRVSSARERWSVPANELWVLGEGGGRGLAAERAELVIDTPVVNPLAVPLHLAVLSGPVPPRGKVLRWLGGTALGHSGAGRFRVRYLAVPRGSEGGDGTPVLHDNPRFFEDASSIRFLIELVMEPGVPWDPPLVDELVLSYKEEAR
jgi:hypothetical protein